jgi:hypothetical protein
MRKALLLRGNTVGCVLLITLGCGGAVDGTHGDGTGGTQSTLPAVGGNQGTAGAPVGGASAGGATSVAVGASGGASEPDACATLGDDHCVTECLKELVLVDNATCANGAWTCRSGYVLASTCPEQACGVTPDACCDLTTGVVTENPCNTDGSRRTCPDGGTETYRNQAWCVPLTLEGATCHSLDRQPCTGPAVSCYDMSMAFVDCACFGLDSDTSSGTWYCSYFIGQ